MAAELIIAPEAQQDVDESYRWYENHRPGLGEEFLGCFSSYIIHLNDWREFATDRYYEEGDQIKFKRYGGFIGIQKDLVREMELVEEVRR